MAIEIGITKLGLDERIDFFATLSAWLTSGGGAFPVNEAVKNTCDAFSRDEFRTLRGKMERIVREYNSGQVLFCDALNMARIGFTEQEIAIVRAAEKANQMRVAIPGLVEALKMRNESGKMLMRKMMMPLVGGFMLILMSLGVMIFMLPVVMGPILGRNPEKINEFPTVIKGYWFTSVWLRDNTELVVLFALAPLIIYLTRNVPIVKRYLEMIMLKIGIIRRLTISYNAVMIVYFMPALVRSGMTLPAVLETLARSLKTPFMSIALSRAAYEHDHGMKLGEAVSTLPLRGSFRNAVEAGEKTGMIAERVEDLKVPYRGEFERIIRKTVAVLTLVVMAGLLPFFIISMYVSLVAPMIALMEY